MAHMKATHYGTCSFCGSLQKLPNGKLAKHGYDVRFGFFNAVCRGSGRAPFETTKQDAEGFLSFIESAIAAYVEQPRPSDKAARREWCNAQSQHSANQHWARWQRQRLAAWEPRQLREVVEVEAEQGEKKSVRSRNLELNAAVRRAKDGLIGAAKELERTLQNSAFAGKIDPWDVPYAAVNTVAKLIRLARTHSQDAEVLQLAADVELLAKLHEAAKDDLAKAKA